MSLYGITAVRVDAKKGQITHARWGAIDGSKNEWIGAQSVVEASVVADALHGGDTVYSIHTYQGHTVLGAQARYVVLGNGIEGIDTLEPGNHPGRTLHDLPKL